MLERFTWFKQSAYLYRGDGLTLYIDPWGVTTPDPADVVVITHAHFDHFEPEDIEKIRKPDTKFVAPRDVARELAGDVTTVAAGDSFDLGGLRGQVVPAYNIVEGRLDSHPKANGWVGYVLTIGDATYYHAGDTDHLPELSKIRARVAFLPVSDTPFTMSPAEAGVLARDIGPEVAVPMHYGFVEEAGTPSNAERFAEEAAPVNVEILKPQNPFEFE
jgi:L-ascorbate metabolism protein UlaG (beta-lactamase superfamily)